MQRHGRPQPRDPLHSRSRIFAEGVETASELDVLRSLGVDKVQGYFVGRPMPLYKRGSAGQPSARTKPCQRIV